MRITVGIVEPFFEHVNDLFTKNMFNFFSVSWT